MSKLVGTGSKHGSDVEFLRTSSVSTSKSYIVAAEIAHMLSNVYFCM